MLHAETLHAPLKFRSFPILEPHQYSAFAEVVFSEKIGNEMQVFLKKWRKSLWITNALWLDILHYIFSTGLSIAINSFVIAGKIPSYFIFTNFWFLLLDYFILLPVRIEN